jgi:class 3 adenylate cyclase
VGKEIEVAIVFADVVGSTKLYELLGDLRARDMVGICIDVMRAATDQNHGTVIKTMGDEVMATFPTADDALNAAAQMQKQIVLHPSLKVDEQTVAINRVQFWAGGAREPRYIRISRTHREPHDQSGQGRSDHHHSHDG